MQHGESADVVGLIKLLAVLAVFGAMAAKLTLDWAAGKRPFRGTADSSDGWTSDSNYDNHHDGWGGDDGGGHGDGGDGGGH